MTEFEQCLLLTLKDIKSELNNISGNLDSVAVQLKAFNEDSYSYNIHQDLEKISKALILIGSVTDERL